MADAEQIYARTKPSYNALKEYLQNASEHVRPPKSPDTNVFDRTGRSYAFPPAEIPQFMDLLNECRRENVCLPLMERRDHGALGPVSGLFFDLDFCQFDKDVCITQRDATAFANFVGGALAAVCEPFPNKWLAPVYVCKRSQLVLKREIDAVPGVPATRDDPFGKLAVYKSGLHIYMPTVRMGRAARRLVHDAVAKSNALPALLGGLRLCTAEGVPIAAEAAAQLLDKNSPYVPTAFYGCTAKPESRLPYILHCAVSVGSSFGSMMGSTMEISADANLTWDMSLDHAPKDPAGRWAPAVVELTPEAAAAANAATARWEATEGALRYASPEATAALEDELEQLCREESMALHLRRMLEQLPAKYADEYGLWRNTIFAIANAGAKMYPLADWFTRRAPDKLAKRMPKLDGLWRAALTPRADDGPRVTMRSIAFWLRHESSPAQYSALVQTLYLELLYRRACEFDGDVQEYTVAEVLATTLRDRFVCDTEQVDSTRTTWYEFVHDRTDCRPGELYKYREEGPMPAAMSRYISERLPEIFLMVIHRLENTAKTAGQEHLAVWYGKVAKNLRKARIKLLTTAFKEKIIKECQVLKFRQRGFTQELENDGPVLGVGNGVVVLHARPEIITGFHEHKIRRYTTTEAVPFDQDDPWVRYVLQKFFVDIIVEPDARMKILLNMAAGLDGRIRDVEMLQFTGPGSNGKSVLFMAYQNALGMYAKTMSIKLLMTGQNEAANAPSSALMQSKGARAMIFNEGKQGGTMATDVIKTLLSMGEGISASEKHKKQETFFLNAVSFVVSNSHLRPESSDDGLWRRISIYKSRRRFFASPDTTNPFEMKLDGDVKVQAKTPKVGRAMLSILMRAHEILHTQYGGSINKFQSETIIRETTIYRNQTDKINRFLSETIIVLGATATAAESITIVTMCDRYKAWHIAAFRVPPGVNSTTRNAQFSVTDMEEMLENSTLKKFIRTTPSGQSEVFGVRLADPEVPLHDDETWLAAGRDNVRNYGTTAFTERDWQHIWGVTANATLPPPDAGDDIVSTAIHDDVPEVDYPDAGDED